MHQPKEWRLGPVQKCTTVQQLCCFAKVCFLGECGIDQGGLKREFFHLLSKSLSKRYMTGGWFRHDSIALQVPIIFLKHMYITLDIFFVWQNEVFLKLGQLAVTSLVQGGSEHHVLSPLIFSYIHGGNVAEIHIKVEDIPDPEVGVIAKQVHVHSVLLYTFHAWVHS